MKPLEILYHIKVYKMALQKGDKVPHFTAQNSDGSLFDSKDYLGVQPLVIYFYPKDNTPGCTTQACDFRDEYEVFKNFGAEVIGISSDSVSSHISFKSKFNLPFILLSDSQKKLSKLFGVAKDFFGLLPGRATYIIDKNGVIQYVFDSASGRGHSKKAISVLKSFK